jgi:hypothetical protein
MNMNGVLKSGILALAFAASSAEDGVVWCRPHRQGWQ